MERIAAVLVTSRTGRAAPPGVDPTRFARAVAEDTYEVVAALDLVTPVLVTTVPGMEEITWPGTPVVTVPEGPSLLADAFGAVAAAVPQAGQAMLLSGDAPDLPGLLVGKLFRALGRAVVAVSPADGGGAVAVAARLPYPEWADVGLDDPRITVDLRTRAPAPRTVATTPGWHRLRAPADLRLLDPGLEGWENTRDLLAG